MTASLGPGDTSPSDVAARASLLSLLADLWFQPVEPRHLGALRAVTDVFPDFGADLGVAQGGLTDLRRAFDRHLQVPGRAALLPYETTHLPPGTRLTGPPRLAQVAEIYQTAGYDLDPFTQYPADHIGHELRFLGALAMREAVSMEAGDEPAVANIRQWEAGFIRDHAGAWIGNLCRYAEEIEAYPFYAALARLSELAVMSTSTRAS